MLLVLCAAFIYTSSYIFQQAWDQTLSTLNQGYHYNRTLLMSIIGSGLEKSSGKPRIQLK